MRVIVADDEILVRAVIVDTIPFERLGMTLAGEASNGIEALKLCRELQPDILVTDIAMPGLTGLELIKEVKTHLPEMKIVIISGYSDFNYAKQAIRLGVNDYVLKPVDENEISSVLHKVKAQILMERRRREEECRNRTNFQKALPVMMEKTLNDIIRPNSYTDDYIRKSLAGHGIGLNYPCFRIALFLLDAPAVAAGRYASPMVKLIARFSKKYLKGILFPLAGTENELICIINYKSSQQVCPEGEDRFMEREFSLFLSLIQKKYRGMASVGLSQASNLVKSLPVLYQQAAKALEESFWEGSGRLFRFKPSLISEKLQLSAQKMEQIMFQIKMSNQQPAHDYIDALAVQLSTSPGTKPVDARDLFWTFIQCLIEKLDISLAFIHKEAAFHKMHPYEKLKSIDLMDKLIKHMKETVVRIQKCYLEKHAGDDVNSVENAMGIIRENLTKDITLEQIARRVHLAPTYFSILFKNKTGMSYLDYKTKIRMETARKLLETTSQTLNEISRQVGYNDQKYFSRLYRKHTGAYPHQHRGK